MKGKNKEKEQLTLLMKIATFVASGLMVLVLLYPIWKIELTAPQYPEGLVLKINANGLGGNVDIVNGLNHYIGMRTLHTEDFIEFTILPYIIAIFAALGLVVLGINRKKVFTTWVIIFLVFAVVSMIDFWKWEYEYGHELNPDAPIKVPGMSYQPPLIGYKQLLNFSAYSIPDTGGWIFIGVGVILVGTWILEFKIRKK
jgi:copper chaperone NosL